MVALRLLTVDARPFGTDRHALARRIEAAGADIACVQHAPSLLRWRSSCAALGRESGLVTVCGGRTAGGVLLLSTLGVSLGAIDELTFSGARGVRPPGAALASLARLEHRFLFAGARFADDRALQPAQAKELQHAIDGLDPARPPAIVCAVGAGSGVALGLQDGRTSAGPGVFVDAGISVGAVADGVVALELG